MNISNTTKIIAGIIAFLLVLDFIGFILWVASSQTPPTGIYWGYITKSLLTLIIN
jgi:hypothetical protein